MPADACTGAIRTSFSRLPVLPDPATNRLLCMGNSAGNVTGNPFTSEPVGVEADSFEHGVNGEPVRVGSLNF